jgi:hypothetical protein
MADGEPDTAVLPIYLFLRKVLISLWITLYHIHFYDLVLSIDNVIPFKNGWWNSYEAVHDVLMQS